MIDFYEEAVRPDGIGFTDRGKDLVIKWTSR